MFIAIDTTCHVIFIESLPLSPFEKKKHSFFIPLTKKYLPAVLKTTLCWLQDLFYSQR